MENSGDTQKRALKALMTSILVVITFCLIKAPNSFSQTKTQITEITFEETSNWVDKMGKYVLSRNRSATMVVPDWKSETGQMLAFRGGFYDFDRLATTMERLGFFRLKTRYSREDVYDANTVVVTAVRHGVRKTVVNYADEGPVNLWALQELLRGLVREVKWERVTAESSPGDLGSPSKRSQFTRRLYPEELASRDGFFKRGDNRWQH